MEALIIVVAVVVVLVLLGGALAARIVKQYEQGVLFRLGRVRGPLDPGFRRPRTRPSRNSTPCPYCSTIFSAIASPIRTSTATMTRTMTSASTAFICP